MVTFHNVGRMGNFLFQAATTLAYAWEHGLEFTVPSTTRDKDDHPLYLQHLVNPKWDPLNSWVKLKEKAHTYSPITFDEYWRNKNIILDGYWQSEKYFKNYRRDVLRAFSFIWNPLYGTVSVHVRRGDYLTVKRGAMFKHPPVTKEWYERAMKKFPSYDFLFFSDDIEWCKTTFGWRSDCRFSESLDEVGDLEAMSGCEHHICSASTFSWWGAWLNQNWESRVIMPAHWITPGWNSSLDTSDIVPAEWERLE
jgi:hypothetical protein